TKLARLNEVMAQGCSVDNQFFIPILMHFAARHAGKSYGAFASDYNVLADANLRCLDDFDLDAVGLISDPYRETSAFGAKVIFKEEAVPVCTEIIVKSIDDVIALKNPDVYKEERTLDRINGARALYKAVGTTTPIIGWVEGPLAEACDLAGVNETLLNVMMDPDFVKRLIDKIMATAKDFAKAQIEAGCTIIGVGDAICSQISAETYQEFVKEKHAELFDFIQQNGAKVKLHICGNITHLLPDIKETKPDIVDLDHLVDMEEAYHLLGDNIVRCGNLDPVSVVLRKNSEEVHTASKELCHKEIGRKFLFSAGCEVPVQTPVANIKAMRKASLGFREIV
ncbi:MAG: uroporphyrinogen decarboxylase family protein, partial [Bacteroidota bacterium]